MWILLLLSVALAAAPVDFARDVYPVLEKNCHGCHGAKSQMGRLRLDSAAALKQGGQSGMVAVAGNPGGSLLIKRVAAGEMPPTRDKLSSGQVAVLRQWIEEGAVWPAGVGSADASVAAHWSYVRPVKKPLPAGRASNAADRFIHARLAREGLNPSPEAPRETLLRRLSLDLTGLPPTLAELDAFLADSSPRAYERQVDRLLESPRFGERWAQWWLDLARYADTNGYESDEPRSNWPWRDWVIGAFNRNLPFSQFTIEQLAGDLLPDRTEDQLIATGFHRNTLINSEAGSKDDEFRDAAVKDRVETTATVWLGSTIGCAQCHNHKYDPFTQRDFYRFYAFFNNTAESSIQLSEEHRVFHGDTAELAARRAKWEPLRKILDTPTPELEAAQVEWERGYRAGRAEVDASWKPLAGGGEQTIETTTPVRFTALRFNEPAGDAAVEAWTAEALEQDRRAESTNPVWGAWNQAGPFEADSPEIAHATAWPPEKAAGGAVAIDDSWRPRPDLPDGAFYGLDGYVCSVYLHRTVTSPQAQRIRVGVASLLGVKVFLNGVQVLASGALEPVEEQRGLIDLDLRAGVNHLLLKYTNGPGYFRYYFKSRVNASHTVRPAHRSPDGKTLLFDAETIAARVRIKFARKPKQEVHVMFSALPVSQLLDSVLLAPDASAADVAKHYRWHSPALARVRAGYDQAKAEFDAFFRKHSSDTLVMRELSPMRESFVQQRGNFLTKVEPVQPGVPAVLPGIDSARTLNRLDLARWLVSPENPLTARVTVNHIWRALFGQGIVKTGEDFGSQGDRPVHPELLDWLAVDFVERGWDFKAFLKQIVMSETYRQSSRSDPARLAKDQDNRLLSRGARFRLSAESIRDVTLASAGLLSAKTGGPSVFPPLPAAVFENLFIETGFQAWPTSTGEDRYRRGLYTFYKRTAPYPTFQTFDAPERAVCTVDRPRSNTPLQALTALNDEVFVEAARALAARLEGGSARERIRHGFRIVTSRYPSPAEMQQLQELFDRTASRYRSDPAAARKLSPGAPDLAPWVVAANVLLNLDEAVTRE
ncbi:MAG: DUF1553 domain-containing protein [Acidobacteria bacterium]|nr:DUF1553 domain-containing protein [Acidobacteriota bacterium]